jgi:hypothetical protein
VTEEDAEVILKGIKEALPQIGFVPVKERHA